MLTSLSTQPEYCTLLQGIKDRILEARIKASRVINRELTLLYWAIGQRIVLVQQEQNWGDAVVTQLSNDLLKSFPQVKGFSSNNLWMMRKFYLEYVNFPILQPLAKELPWSHNVAILNHAKDMEAKEYYLKAAHEMAWSKRVLIHQIKAQTYERHGVANKQHNFEEALPKHIAEQADLAMKDSYMLDFLGITKPILESELENQMIHKIKNVILELGYGFSFIGNQYNIKANNSNYFIDMLFYNRKIKSLVAIELKIGEFKPEYAGKMNFYLNLLDDFVKEADENPSIGIILCSKRSRFEVEYTLRGLRKPVGVSEYHFTKKLPKEFEDKLPAADSLEKELTATLFNEIELDSINL